MPQFLTPPCHLTVVLAACRNLASSHSGGTEYDSFSGSKRLTPKLHPNCMLTEENGRGRMAGEGRPTGCGLQAEMQGLRASQRRSQHTVIKPRAETWGFLQYYSTTATSNSF